MALSSENAPLVFHSCVLILLCQSPLSWQVSYGSGQHVPLPTIYALRPRGVRITVPDVSGLSSAALHANINRPIARHTAGQLNAELTLVGRQWLYEDLKTALNDGDSMYYWMQSIFDGEVYITEGKVSIPFTSSANVQSVFDTGQAVNLNTAVIPIVIERHISVKPISSTNNPVVIPAITSPNEQFPSMDNTALPLQSPLNSGTSYIFLKPVAVSTNPSSTYLETASEGGPNYDQNQYGGNLPILTETPTTLVHSQTSNNDLNGRPFALKPVDSVGTQPVQQHPTTGYRPISSDRPVQPLSSSIYQPTSGGWPVQPIAPKPVDSVGTQPVQQHTGYRPTSNERPVQPPSSSIHQPTLGGRPVQPIVTTSPLQQYPSLDPTADYDIGGRFPKCELSQTTVNGQRVCRGEVVLLDTFRAYNSSLWTYDMEFPSLPDGEFCVFTGLRDNSRFTGDSMQITPSLTESKYGEGFVFSGRLDLPDCTALAHDRCSQEGEFAYILPPTLSSRYSTRGHWSFRYGRVDIVAKPPLGHWLYPELWLEPASRRTTGNNELSNRIEMAVIRGNARLRNVTGEDIGASLLEVGAWTPSWSRTDFVRRVFKLRETRNRLWTESFHTFTVLWMEDVIAFSVDGVEIGVVASRDNLISPTVFNTEMNIVIGLGVGGVRVFPDCDEKPWINTEPKAMYKFWNAKDSWYRTWTREGSSLIVKSVKVTAL